MPQQDAITNAGVRLAALDGLEDGTRDDPVGDRRTDHIHEHDHEERNAQFGRWARCEVNGP